MLRTGAVVQEEPRAGETINPKNHVPAHGVHRQSQTACHTVCEQSEWVRQKCEFYSMINVSFSPQPLPLSFFSISHSNSQTKYHCHHFEGQQFPGTGTRLLFYFLSCCFLSSSPSSLSGRTRYLKYLNHMVLQLRSHGAGVD